MNIQTLIQNKDWRTIVNGFPPDIMATFFTFRGGLKLAYQLLFSREQETARNEYAILLLKAIRDIYSDEWNSSWKYNAFLGMACGTIEGYHDDNFISYKRAMEASDSPPPRLLTEMARCCKNPGYPRLPTVEAIWFLKEANKEYLYTDAVELLCWIYAYREEPKEQKYWNELYNSIKDTNISSPSIDPEGVQEEIEGKECIVYD
jgi:hypothetical protein